MQDKLIVANDEIRATSELNAYILSRLEEAATYAREHRHLERSFHIWSFCINLLDDIHKYQMKLQERRDHVQ